MLSAEDRAILALEGPTVAGHTCKVITLGDRPLEVDELRRHMARRLPADSPLRRRLGSRDGEPAWVVYGDFDLAEHVRARGAAGQDLSDVVAAIFSERLDRAVPLWRIDVAEIAGTGTVLVWRIHHALADGTTAMRIARGVLWDEIDAVAAPSSGHHHGRADERRRRDHLGAFIARELTESTHRSPFDGEIGTERDVAFASVPLAPLHDAARALAGATVNDAVLATVGGGLRSWLEAHDVRPHSLRIKVPVSLHHEAESAANRDSFFSLPVNLGRQGSVTALRDIHRASTTRKRGHDAQQWETLAASLSSHSRRLGAALEKIQRSPRAFAVCVSNVPGPPGELHVAERPVLSVHSVAEIGRRHNLRIAVISAAGALNIGFCCDPAVVPDLEVMAAATEDAAEALIAAA